MTLNFLQFLCLKEPAVLLKQQGGLLKQLVKCVIWFEQLNNFEFCLFVCYFKTYLEQLTLAKKQKFKNKYNLKVSKFLSN